MGRSQRIERTESILKVNSLTLRPLRMITGLATHTAESHNQRWEGRCWQQRGAATAQAEGRVLKAQPVFRGGQEVKLLRLQDILLTVHLETGGQKERVWENGLRWGIELG